MLEHLTKRQTKRGPIMTPRQAIETVQLFGEAFMEVPEGEDYQAVTNRLTASAKRANIQITRQQVVMVMQKDMSTVKYVKITLAEEAE